MPLAIDGETTTAERDTGFFILQNDVFFICFSYWLNCTNSPYGLAL